MSKKKGKRRKHPRRKSPPALCRHCSAPKDTSPQAFPRAIARILNTATGEGLKVAFGHGAVLVDPIGWVMFIDGRWVPRLVTCPPGAKVSARADDLDD